MAEVSFLHLHLHTDHETHAFSPDLHLSPSDQQHLFHWTNSTRINHLPDQSPLIPDHHLVGSDLTLPIYETDGVDVDNTDLNDLETDFGFGLGLGFAMEECNYDADDDDDAGFMVADCGDEFIVSGSERREGDRSETYFMGGISLVDSDEDHEDDIIRVNDDFDINLSCDDDDIVDDDEGTITLCWDAFRLDDDDDNNDDDNNGDDNNGDHGIRWDVPTQQQFEWEEVDGDVREVLNNLNNNIPPGAEPEADHWEVFLNSHNLDPNPNNNDVDWEVFLNVDSLDGNLDLEEQFEDYNDAEHDMLFGQFADNIESPLVQPPASRKAVDNLLSVVMTVKDHENNNAHCAVCKDEIGVGEMAKQLPCTHHYHGDCIGPWLCIRNTCPVCRHELPTDDPGYELRKAERAASRV